MTRTENRLLLIDPYKNLLQAYSLLLGELGFPLDTALSLEEAQAHLAKKEYALIISELLYPPRDCLNFWEETKRRKPDTFVIVMTDSILTDYDYKEFFERGADDLVSKPCSPEKLLIHIRRGLRYRDLQVTGNRLKRLALMDPLTEAANKVVLGSEYFRQCLRQEMKKAKRHGEPLSLVWVNTTNAGHVDTPFREFIKELAGLLGRNIREEDLLGREEGALALILPKTGREGTRFLTERLTGTLRNHLPFQKAPFHSLFKKLEFKSYTYPDKTDLPESYTELLTEIAQSDSLH